MIFGQCVSINNIALLAYALVKQFNGYGLELTTNSTTYFHELDPLNHCKAPVWRPGPPTTANSCSNSSLIIHNPSVTRVVK